MYPTLNILPTILVVVDDADMREHISSILSNSFNVITANNGVDALNKMKETVPTLVLSDIMIPVMDGIGLLKEIKSNKATANIPVIFLLARAGEESKIEGWETGADDYLVIPFAAEELIARVTAQLRMVKLRQSLESNVRNLFMQAPAIICVLKGPQHVFELANEMYLQLIGKRDVLEKTVREVMPELEGQGYLELLDNVYATGEPYTGNETPAQIDKGNGKLEEAYFNFVYQPTHTDEGKIDGVLLHGIDVTEQVLARKKIEENENQLQNIFLNAPAAIAIFEGPQHKYILANKAYEKLSNRKAADLLGKSMEVLFPELIGTGTLELFDKVLETGESFSAPEYALMLDLKNEGALRQYYFNFSMESLKNGSGENYAVLAVTYDITEQVESRKKLEESESRFRLMANAIPEIIWVGDAQGKPEFLNKRWEEFSGVPFESGTVAEVAAEFLHPDDVPALLAAVSEAIKTGNVMEVEHRNRSASGEYRWFLNRAAPYRNPQTGEIEKWFGIGTDINERKKTEKALAESESRFRAVLEQAPLAIVITGARGEIQFDNTMFEELWGRPAQETEVSTYSQVYAGFHLDGTAIKSEEWPAAKAIMNGEVIIDEIIEIAHVSGRKIPCSFNAGPIHDDDGKITGAVVLFRDVTVERTASMQLQESEEKYRTLFNSLQDAFCIIEMIFDENGVPIDWIYKETNLAFALHATVEMKGKRVSETVPELETFWLEKYGGVAKTGDPVQLEHMVKGLGDQWFQTSAFRQGPEGSNKVAVLFRNITARKQADEKLKESESRFRTMADASPVLIWTIDAGGLSSYYNKTFRDFIGISKDEDISDWAKIVHPKDLKFTFHTINTAMAERRPYALELRLLRADGQWRWVLAQSNPNIGTNNEFLGFIGSSVDITERKEAEVKIKESEKLLEQKVIERTEQLEEKNIELQRMNKELEAFTYVSSHDLQEPLRKIQTFAGQILATEYENLSENAKEYFGRMQVSASRMQALIQDLLAFSRLSTSERIYELTVLKKIVDEVKEEFKESIEEKNAAVTTGEMCEVNIVPFQFRQLMHNLISNALKFSKQEVPLHVMIESKIVSGSASPLNCKKTCHITVTDNGIGFKKQYAEKIFEVFQKLHVKENYAGTGIGLAIVKKIVENHNGKVTAESEFGKGTCFNIYIPA